MYEKEIVIVNETGLHARPATEFVQLAGTFASTITLRHAENERAFHAKSILMVCCAKAIGHDRIVISRHIEIYPYIFRYICIIFYNQYSVF